MSLPNSRENPPWYPVTPNLFYVLASTPSPSASEIDLSGITELLGQDCDDWEIPSKEGSQNLPQPHLLGTNEGY